MKDFILSTKALSKMVQPQEMYMEPIHSDIVAISGASGFLGLHLIEALQMQNVSHIKAFVRSKEKFLTKQNYFRLDLKEIEVIENPKPHDFKQVGHFFHCAATLNSLKSVQSLWENVTLTQNYLAQCEGVFHNISTLSVFASSNQKEVSPTILPINDNYWLYGGYAQTKWLSEYLCSFNPSSKIYRLGLLTPSKKTPIFQEHEFFRFVLKTLKTWGVYPENYTEAYVDISPVDEVAKLIAKNYSNTQQVTHIAGQKRLALSEIIQTLNLKAVDEITWSQKLLSLRATQRVLMDYTFFKPRALEKYFHYFNIDVFQSTNHEWCGTIPSLPLSRYLEHLDEDL